MSLLLQLTIVGCNEIIHVIRFPTFVAALGTAACITCLCHLKKVSAVYLGS
jgi:hypothetical protein